MYYHPEYCRECQECEPARGDGLTRPSWGLAAHHCKVCSRKVCGTKHPLLQRGMVIDPGQAGKCGDCDYQDYLNSPGGM